MTGITDTSLEGAYNEVHQEKCIWTHYLSM